MMDFVKEAFEKERVYQEEAEIRCTVTAVSYTHLTLPTILLV